MAQRRYLSHTATVCSGRWRSRSQSDAATSLGGRVTTTATWRSGRANRQNGSRMHRRGSFQTHWVVVCTERNACRARETSPRSAPCQRRSSSEGGGAFQAAPTMCSKSSSSRPRDSDSQCPVGFPEPVIRSLSTHSGTPNRLTTRARAEVPLRCIPKTKTPARATPS